MRDLRIGGHVTSCLWEGTGTCLGKGWKVEDDIPRVTNRLYEDRLGVVVDSLGEGFGGSVGDPVDANVKLLESDFGLTLVYATEDGI